MTLSEAKRPDGVVVEDLLGPEAQRLAMTLRAGRAGLSRPITYPRIQKAALAVAGYVEAIHEGRVQIVGSTEITYLKSQAPRKRAAILHRVCSMAPVTCFVVTRGLEPPEELLAEAERHGIPLLTTDLLSSTCIDLLQRFLDDRLAPRTTVHGVLVDVFGLGVLMLGESGIGKSECALDLITRGHRLVSDDIVEIRRESNGTLLGEAPELSRYHMEIRGLGVINIRDLFGISAIRDTKFVELVVMLEAWVQGKEYDRLGLDEATYDILGAELPLARMPVAPGRNLAMLVEVATRNQLLKRRGFHAARRLNERLLREMGVGRDDVDGSDPDARDQT